MYVGCVVRWRASRNEGPWLEFWGLLGAIFNLNHPAHTVDWEFIHLSVTNVVVIGLMFVVFFLAILLPFLGAARRDASRRGGGS